MSIRKSRHFLMQCNGHVEVLGLYDLAIRNLRLTTSLAAKLAGPCYHWPRSAWLRLSFASETKPPRCGG